MARLYRALAKAVAEGLPSVGVPGGLVRHGGFAKGGRTFCSGPAGAEAATPSAEATATGGAWPYLLGLGGLVPFVCLTPPAAAAVADSLPELMDVPGVGCVFSRAAEMQKNYAATIASFLGAVHWGTALAGGGRPTALRFTWGVVPSLMAWASLGLPSHEASLAGLTGSLASCYVVDSHFFSQGLLPRWYMRLRLPLTLVACGSLSLSLYSAWSEREQEQAKAKEKTQQ